MHIIRTLRNLPLFPVIPIVPAAIFIGSIAISVSALRRVRRLERRLAALSGA